MSRILILTKNILFDQQFQNELQSLNCEVLCSNELLRELVDDSNLVDVDILSKNYNVVILSETISDKESFILLKKFSSYSVYTIRKDEYVPTKEKLEEWKVLGLRGWIHTKTTKSEIRELLNTFKLEEIIEHRFEKQLAEKRYPIPKLSSLELKLIETLYQVPDHKLSREELCQIIWGNGMTKSNLSNLSCLIRKIKIKFLSSGFEQNCITTLWGEGYQINQKFYDRYENKLPIHWRKNKSST